MTSCDRGAPREVIALSVELPGADPGLGEQDTSMSDRELDRVLEFLAQTGHIAGVREPGVGCARWRRLRLLSPGLTAVGAWPPAEERHLLPTGCARWDGRDAPLLGHIAARGPLGTVPCRPAGGTSGAHDALRDALPLTPVDVYWSLVTLRDAELVSGVDCGEAGWRDVRVTERGRALAERMTGPPAPAALA